MSSTKVWEVRRPTFRSDLLDPDRRFTPWTGHRSFVYDLIGWQRPRRIVELGSHYGPSFFAMCQAVEELDVDAELHAVDTWAGDPHAGEYGEDVYESFTGVLDRGFETHRVTLHRMTFDEALGDFDAESVDLLHIDGFHTYEAVAHDYETWLPKLAPGGIVLFHDVAPSMGYGSSQFWQDVRRGHPHFEFRHSCGLGVLAPKSVGDNGWLFGDEAAQLLPLYEFRGRSELAEQQVADLTRMVDERVALIESQQRLIEGRDEALAAQVGLIEDRNEALAAQAALIDERTAALRSLEQQLADQQSSIRDRDEAIRAQSALIDDLAATNAALRRPLPVRIVSGLRRRSAALGKRSARHVVSTMRPTAKRLYYSRSGRTLRRIAPRSVHSRLARVVERLQHVGSPAIDVRQRSHSLPHVTNRYGLDEAYYSTSHRVPASAAIEAYLERGVARGALVYPGHLQAIESEMDGGRARMDPQAYEFRLHEIGGGVRPIDRPSVADFPLVTFDFWDTLIRRDRPPESPKRRTAQRLRRHAQERSVPSVDELVVLRTAIEAELAASRDTQEYAVDEVLAELVSRVAPELAPHVSDLVAREIGDEAQHVTVISEVAELYEQARRSAAVEVLSDFYIGRDGLRGIGSAAGLEIEAVEVRSSCEAGASKRVDGRLFGVVRHAHEVTPADHLHVGDNPYSDVAMQVSTGGTALHVSPGREVATDATFATQAGRFVQEIESEMIDRALSVYHSSREPLELRRAAFAGAATALFPLALTTMAVQSALEDGASTLHYMSREGLFLQRLHDAVSAARPASDHAQLQTSSLPLSRRATFGPSVCAEELPRLARLTASYPVISPEAVLVTLGVDTRPFAGRSGFSTPVDTSTDHSIERFLADPVVADAVTAALSVRRTALEAWGEQQLVTSGGQVHCVDIGWRGTIQDNLARVFDHFEWTGYYLGLFPLRDEQPANASKTAAAFDAAAGDDFSYADPPAAVERPWTPDVPSIVDVVQAGSRFTLVEDARDQGVSDRVAVFQTHAIEAAVMFADRFEGFALSPCSWRSVLGPRLRDYYERPVAGIADIWFESLHDDTFGALGVTPYAKERPSAAWAADYPASLERAARASRWPAGYLSWLPVSAVREAWTQ
jgi:FMN phosphatase YigB (HAD superfamily)/predicted O-methyltransferase YrrM